MWDWVVCAGMGHSVSALRALRVPHLIHYVHATPLLNFNVGG